SMSTLIKNIIRFILFIAVQVYILNQIPPLHRFVVPYLYFLYIIWLPFTLNKFTQIFIAFIFGLTLDAFTGTMGLHAAACVLIAYIKPFLLSLLI
ncbi:rod shape-determining protein MreD, partial [Pseudomonas aeruginosa]|uniref:rod shape-determining protein MreD n=1 Tax=Pseudomonas aeruginosa TaxID=287 RepID=UPI002B4100CA